MKYKLSTEAEPVLWLGDFDTLIEREPIYFFVGAAREPGIGLQRVTSQYQLASFGLYQSDVELLPTDQRQPINIVFSKFTDAQKFGYSAAHLYHALSMAKEVWVLAINPQNPIFNVGGYPTFLRSASELLGSEIKKAHPSFYDCWADAHKMWEEFK